MRVDSIRLFVSMDKVTRHTHVLKCFMPFGYSVCKISACFTLKHVLKCFMPFGYSVCKISACFTLKHVLACFTVKHLPFEQSSRVRNVVITIRHSACVL